MFIESTQIINEISNKQLFVMNNLTILLYLTLIYRLRLVFLAIYQSLTLS